MGKKSIYVSVPCLCFDEQLITTIGSCIENSSKENDIRIHVACIGDKNFYNSIRVQTTNFKNLEISYYELEGNYGVGRGRKHAASKYNNEDYFLEIDAHTLFEENWDNVLIETLEEAIEFTNNPKTVITAYLCSYKKSEMGYGKPFIRMPFMGWLRGRTISSTNIDTDTTYDTEIPMWSTIDEDNDKDDKWIKVEEAIAGKKFVPSIKVCGQFIFGNQNFGKDTRLDEKILFWEEEIIQSIELLNDGFDILYPNIYSILNHYSQEQSSTQSRITFYQLCSMLKTTVGEYLLRMRDNYKDYIFDPANAEKIENYKKYANIDLKTNTITSTTIYKDI
jgi:hypothetical protein